VNPRMLVGYYGSPPLEYTQHLRPGPMRRPLPAKSRKSVQCDLVGHALPHYMIALGRGLRGYGCAGQARAQALASPTAVRWPGCALAAAPLVIYGLPRAVREDSGRCGAFLRRQALVCARILESPVRTGRSGVGFWTSVARKVALF
jgi:hypothetical protein